MAKKQARQIFGFDCKECGSRNYVSEKNSLKTKDKMEMKKYCKKCRKRTTHEENKKLH